MAETLTLSDINFLLKGQRINDKNAFSILKAIGQTINNNENDVVQETVLRVIEQRHLFKKYEPLVNDLARQIGLFPYLNIDQLSLADKIAYEFHRPEGFEESQIVLHRVQALVYFKLLDGGNVVLSAPTSFGKSLLIDTLLAANRYKNIAIVLPTIALIDETRKRVSKFKSVYKIITQSSQKRAAKNIFILTQERVMEIINESNIDFFVIDEFYKIQLSAEDQDRSLILNQAFYKLLKKGAQFYLLGPNIENINSKFIPEDIVIDFIKTDYKTVVTEKVVVDTSQGSESALIQLTSTLSDSTLIYCKSPKSAGKVAKILINSGNLEKTERCIDAVNWLKEQYHPLWNVPEALEYGIGIHHGKIPRAIAQYTVKAFNDKKLKFLICTSTLIEGVNTTAKNVIIYDNQIANDKFDFFTFNNICGRSGRMFKHFIGFVYLFHKPPIQELPVVDFPIFSQQENVSEKLLIQMEMADLSIISKNRTKHIYDNAFLSVATIKQNSSIEPDDQISLAKHLKVNLNGFHRLLSWTRYPSSDQLNFCCSLIWDYFVKSKFIAGVSSGKQLAFKIGELRKVKSVKALIREEIKLNNDVKTDIYDPDLINGHIEDVLEFVRFWAQFHFPSYLRSLDRIQQELFNAIGINPGNYSFFASQVECLFTRPLFVALDEYGIPIPTSNRLKEMLNADSNLDDLLNQIKVLQIDNLDISSFEKELLKEVQLHI